MRVLHVHTRYRNPGGEDSVVAAERALLSESGLELATLDFQNPSSAWGSAADLARAPWNRSASLKVVEAARRHQAEVVHIHNTWFALSPAVVTELHRAGFPVVMTFHNYRLVCVNAMLFRDGHPCEVCVGGSTLPGVRYGCYRGSRVQSAVVSATIQLHRARHTWSEGLSTAIALTEFARDRLVQGGLPADRTVVKPNFVIDPGPRANKPSASNRVLFVGRLAPEKGVRALVEAWHRVRAEGLELHLAGIGPEEGWLRENAGPSISLLGHVSAEEVKSLMLASRALVVPSLWYEGMPMVILEAVASGLPVFYTDIGALAETVGSGGRPLGRGAVDTMSEQLRRLNDGTGLDSLGSLARLEYESRFTQSKSAEALREIYAKSSS